MFKATMKLWLMKNRLIECSQQLQNPIKRNKAQIEAILPTAHGILPWNVLKGKLGRGMSFDLEIWVESLIFGKS